MIGKEYQAITSTPTGKDLLLFQSVLSLHHFLQYTITHNFVIASKVTALEMDSMFFFAYCLIHIQAVFRFGGKCHCGRRISLHKLLIARDDLHQWIDEHHRKDHQ